MPRGLKRGRSLGDAGELEGEGEDFGTSQPSRFQEFRLKQKEAYRQLEMERDGLQSKLLQMEQLKRDVLSLQDKNEQLQNQDYQLQRKNDQLQSQNDQLQSKIEQLQSQNNQLQSQNDTFSNVRAMLVKPETFPSGVVKLLGENTSVPQFVNDVRTLLQRTCEGVNGENHINFVTGFYAGEVVIRAGNLVGIPEAGGKVIRSIHCMGVAGHEKRCSSCNSLASTISKVKNQFQNHGTLAPLSPFQKNQLKKPSTELTLNKVDEDGHRLVQTLTKVLNDGRLTENSFLRLFLKVQLENLSKENAKNWSFPTQFLHWALSLQFLGGKGVIEWLRGDATKKVDQHGRYSPGDINLILPSTRTLRAFGPVPCPYDSLSPEVILKIIGGLPEGIKSGGLVADEMEVRAGLTYVPYMAQLIGLEKTAIYEREVDVLEWGEGQTRAALVTKALQLFFVSTDGSACVPVGYAGTIGISGTALVDLLEPIMDTFSSHL